MDKLRFLLALMVGLVLCEPGQRLANAVAIHFSGPAKLSDGFLSADFVIFQMPALFILFSVASLFMHLVSGKLSIFLPCILMAATLLKAVVAYYCGIVPVWYSAIHLFVTVLGMAAGSYIYSFLLIRINKANQSHQATTAQLFR